MKAWMAAGGIVCGIFLVVTTMHSLRESGAVKYHDNPFALKQSGYGTVLARLGQKNLDRAWHYGSVAGELAEQQHFEGDGHDHGKHGGESGNGTPDGDHGEGISGDNQHQGGGKNKSPSKNAESSHVGEEKGDHEHDENRETWLGSIVEGGVEILVDLDSERFRRTSRFAFTEAHKKAVAQEIERTLLRSYNMDPTDFGVYNSYYHFLTLHEMRGREEDIKGAFSVSEHSYQLALKNDTDPMPYLTAATAVLNQFFLEQRKFRREKGDHQAELPRELLEKNRSRVGYCLAQFVKLREAAIQEGRWHLVPGERRLEADDRLRRSLLMYKQFDAMLERHSESREKK